MEVFNKVNFEFLVDQYFNFIDYYISYELGDKARQNFKLIFNKEFIELFGFNPSKENVLKYIETNEELKVFFVRKTNLILKFYYGIYNFKDDKKFVKDLFFEFYEDDLEVEIYNRGSVNEELELPTKAFRYDINSVISEFSNDVINGKISGLCKKYDNSKKLLFVFTYLCMFTQFDKKYQFDVDGKSIDIKSILLNSFSTLKVKDTLKNGGVEQVVSGNKKIKIINEMTDAFAHASGNFNYIKGSNGNDDLLEFKNRFNLTININVDDFISSMSSIFTRDLMKDLKGNFGCLDDFFDLILRIKFSGYGDITKEQIVLLMGYLELCFNQESTLNNVIMSQYSLVDTSVFDLDYGIEVDDEIKSSVDLFKSHTLVFVDDNSRNVMLSDWGSNINNLSEENKEKKNASICDIKRMCFDKKNNMYFPSSEVIKHLRNALRHGFYNIDNDIIHFWDVNNGVKYFNLSISFNKFREFLSNSLIHEVMHIRFDNLYDNDQPIRDFTTNVIHKKNYFYETEIAYSKNSFSNYMNICRTRFIDLTDEEFVEKLYDNNLFSKYLIENPERTQEFIDYRFKDGIFLRDILNRNYKLGQVHGLEFDNIKKLVQSSQDYVKSLIEFEKGLTATKESVYFPLYVKWMISQSLVEKEGDIPDEIVRDYIESCIDKRESLINGINYNSLATKKCLLGLGLFDSQNVSESVRILVALEQYHNLYFDLLHKDKKVYDYNSCFVTRSDSEMYLDSSKVVVSKLKKNSFKYKTMSKYMNSVGVYNMGLGAFFALYRMGLMNDAPGFIQVYTTLYNQIATYFEIKSIEHAARGEFFENFSEYYDREVVDVLSESEEYFQDNVRSRLR